VSAYLAPHGDIRAMAATLRQMYNALVEVGFSTDEASTLTSDWWRAMHQPKGNNG
jgi:hypothetical protein